MTGKSEAQNAAEEFPDPLDGLIGRVLDDPGAPFVPEVLEALSALKGEDLAAFDVISVRLKDAGCR